MKLDIIIPVYNVEEEFFRPCLDSILAQTSGNWRVVLVDDGSTNGAERICDEYAKRDARFHVIHQANAGEGAARNTGLEHVFAANPDCNGWIWFVDADDIAHPNAVEAWEWNTTKFPEVDFWHFGYHQCGKGFRFGDQDAAFSLDGRKIAPNMLPRLCVCGGFFRMQLVRDVRFGKLKIGEDLLFIYRAASNGRQFGMLPFPLYGYVHRPSSAMNSMSFASLSDCIEFADRYMATCAEYGSFFGKNLWNSALIQFYFGCARDISNFGGSAYKKLRGMWMARAKSLKKENFAGARHYMLLHFLFAVKCDAVNNLAFCLLALAFRCSNAFRKLRTG